MPASNCNLGKARHAKQDEFYTQLSDIEMDILNEQQYIIILVRELTDGYKDNEEAGVVGFGGKLDILDKSSSI